MQLYQKVFMSKCVDSLADNLISEVRNFLSVMNDYDVCLLQFLFLRMPSNLPFEQAFSC